MPKSLLLLLTILYASAPLPAAPPPTQTENGSSPKDTGAPEPVQGGTDSDPVASEPSAEPDLTFTPLFNGRDLVGWRQFRATALPDRPMPDGRVPFRFEPTHGAWKAEAGQLVCVSRGENAAGFIRTARHFSDFVLRLKFRVPPNCNSKVLLRLPDVTVGRSDDEAVAVQIADDYGRQITEARSRTGAIYRVAGPDRTLLRPDGQWNELEVRCEGDRVRVTLNGEPAADVDLEKEPLLKDRPRSGYIGFACFAEPVDGPWFRDVEIAELSDGEGEPVPMLAEEEAPEPALEPPGPEPPPRTLGESAYDNAPERHRQWYVEHYRAARAQVEAELGETAQLRKRARSAAQRKEIEAALAKVRQRQADLSRNDPPLIPRLTAGALSTGRVVRLDTSRQSSLPVDALRRLTVFQVVGFGEVLVQPTYLEPGPLLLLRNVDTTDVVVGAEFARSGLFSVTGTDTYVTVNGATNTVFVLEPVHDERNPFEF